jgi:hypothetical protein
MAWTFIGAMWLPAACAGRPARCMGLHSSSLHLRAKRKVQMGSFIIVVLNYPSLPDLTSLWISTTYIKVCFRAISQSDSKCNRCIFFSIKHCSVGWAWKLQRFKGSPPVHQPSWIRVWLGLGRIYSKIGEKWNQWEAWLDSVYGFTYGWNYKV